MADDQLEGFDDLDNLFPDEGGGAPGGDALGDMDDILGDMGGGAPAPAAEKGGGGGGGGGGDEELDSFFEDLSTIDDLEVMDEAPAAAAPAPKAAPSPAPAAAAPAPKAEPRKKEKPPKAPHKPLNLNFKKRLTQLVFLALLGGAAYWLIFFFLPSEEVPWEVMEEEAPKEEAVVAEPPPPPPTFEPKKAAPPAPPKKAPPPPPAPAKKGQPPAKPPAPQPVVAQPEPAPKPAPKPRHRAAPIRGGWSVQVATCFFDECVADYARKLKPLGYGLKVEKTGGESQTVELFSRTRFQTSGQAEQWAEQINREHRMEGRAFVTPTQGGFLISMGSFPDLERANAVKDVLNQRLSGEVVFTVRLKDFGYQMKHVKAGPFRSREEALAARRKLVERDEASFRDAFLVKNPR